MSHLLRPLANELMLVNVKTGKCLTIAGGVSTQNNVDAVQFDCDSDPSRRWTLSEATGADVYQIKNVQTGKCLTIAGGVSTDNNVTALQFDCDSHPSRSWRINRRDRRRRLSDQECADQQVPDYRRGVSTETT